MHILNVLIILISLVFFACGKGGDGQEDDYNRDYNFDYGLEPQGELYVKAYYPGEPRGETHPLNKVYYNSPYFFQVPGKECKYIVIEFYEVNANYPFSSINLSKDPGSSDCRSREALYFMNFPMDFEIKAWIAHPNYQQWVPTNKIQIGVVR